MGPAKRGLREGGYRQAEGAAGGGAGEEAEAWGGQAKLRLSRALFLSPRSLGAVRARGEREAAEVPAGRRPAPARPAPEPADSCSWARAVRSRLRGLRPPRAPSPPPLPLLPRCGSFRNCSPLAPCPAVFYFPAPLLEYFGPCIWGEGLARERRSVQRRRKRGREEEDRRTVGRRPHATLSGPLPSRPAPTHTPSPASYFRTGK